MSSPGRSRWRVPRIENRRHTLDISVPRGVATDGDPARLAQVFGNLLNNAAKYTEPGGISSRAAARENDEAVVRVHDTGRGIAPEMLPQVFDLFVQERQGSHRAQGGLGIGLAIVRSLVEAHAGSVAATSAGKGAGSTFTVRLPASNAAEATDTTNRTVPSFVAQQGARVLVVDDNEHGAELLGDSLRALGYTVDVGSTGQPHCRKPGPSCRMSCYSISGCR